MGYALYIPDIANPPFILCFHFVCIFLSFSFHFPFIFIFISFVFTFIFTFIFISFLFLVHFLLLLLLLLVDAIALVLQIVHTNPWFHFQCWKSRNKDVGFENLYDLKSAKEKMNMWVNLCETIRFVEFVRESGLKVHKDVRFENRIACWKAQHVEFWIVIV